MDDRGADLALDVVADDRHAGVLELLGPFGVARDEHRNGVHEGDARVERGLGVVLLGLLRTDGQVRDEDVGARVAQCLRYVDGLGGRLLDRLAVVGAESVERRPSLHEHTELRDVRELDRVVDAREDRLAEVETDLVGGNELDITDVVAAELDVHQTGDALGRVGVAVVLDALDQAAGAVPDAGDGDANRPPGLERFVVGGVGAAHVSRSRRLRRRAARAPFTAQRDTRFATFTHAEAPSVSGRSSSCAVRSSAMSSSIQSRSCWVECVRCSRSDRV